MSARDDIAAAASAVSGVSVTSKWRQALNPGQGFVRIASTTRPQNGIGWLNTWQVWIAIPQDAAAAETWLDDHMVPLAAAVRRELAVTNLTPAQLVLVAGGPGINGLIIEGVRAAD